MFNTFRWAKRVEVATIKEKRCRNRGYTAHTKLNKIGREVEKDKHFPDKAPLNLVVRFLKFNLNSHVPLTAFSFAYKMDQLLNNNNIVSSSPAQNESHLVRRDKVLQMQSKLSHNNLGDDFINSIAKTNRSVITNGLWVLDFRNEHNKGSIKIFRNLFSMKTLLTSSKQIPQPQAKSVERI